jgi:hypothetical protein
VSATLERIVSGGQTGADRGGLNAAMALGIDHGGWCPRGRRAEDGTIPDRYVLVETTSSSYAARTEKNVVDSDATILFTPGPPTGGSALTVAMARKHGRPLLHINIDATNPDTEPHIRRWVAEHEVRVLNVAGSRESGSVGMAATVERILFAAFASSSQ